MKKKKNTFLGESYRADALTDKWPKRICDFEIISWELKHSDTFFNRIRIIEFKFALLKIKKIIKLHQPDMVIAERTTSYGFLAALSV
jgi:hypothetical protein